MDERTVYPYFEDVNLGLLRIWGQRRNLDVLDVGCGFGTTSQRIQRLGNRVTGIESSAEAAAVAMKRLERVVTADLHESDRVRAQLSSASFDVIIFADVLEHTAWPVGVLRRYLDFLRPGGSVIISVPNIGVWSVRLGLLLGRFNYTDSGVLDATHLRFFTGRTVRELLDRAGLRPKRTTYNPGIVRAFLPLIKRLSAPGGDPRALLESRGYAIYTRFVHPVEAAVTRVWPGMLGFQIVTEAERKP